MKIKNIIPLGRAELAEYLKKDYLLEIFSSSPEANQFLGCNKWLVESPQKRTIFNLIYADLLCKKNNKTKENILDIGSGINLAQPLIAMNCNMTIVEALSHDNIAMAKQMTSDSGIELRIGDWYEILENLPHFNIIIANDIFPNVDQRLVSFLKSVSRLGDEIRVSLTLYPDGKFYNVKRIDAEEKMCMKAWSVIDVYRSLTDEWPELKGSELEKLLVFDESIFDNGRTVFIVTFIPNP